MITCYARKRKSMNKKIKAEKNNKPLGLVIFVLGFLLLILAANVDRICYIVFLKQNGYGLKDIFVPWEIFFEYHTSGIGLFLTIVIAVLITVLILVLWRPFFNKK